MFGLSSGNWNLIKSLAVKPLQDAGATVWVFGSRARHDHRPFSDLDLLYVAARTLPADFVGNVREALESSSLPIVVELVDEAYLESSYRDAILRERVLIPTVNP